MLLQLNTHLKDFIINMRGIIYLASVLQLLCNQVAARLDNGVCSHGVLRPEPVRCENKRSVKRVV